METPLIGTGSQEEVDIRVKAMLDLGKSRGYLTYEELNEKLPGRSGLAGQARFAADDDRRDGHQAHRRDRHRRVHASPRKRQGRAEARHDRRQEPSRASPKPVVEGRRRRDRPEPRSRAGRGLHQAHRRSGAHVPHPDGRDPPAHPRAGNRAGQEDRNHPQDFPLARCSKAITAFRRRSRFFSRSTTAICRSTAR